MKVLVDTSVWSLALRRKHHSLSGKEARVVAELLELIREGRAQMVGLVRQELLSGVKTAEQFEALRQKLQSFPDERMESVDHEDAARSGNQCRARGVAASIVDALLCAAAMRRGWALFSTDPDFSRFATVLPLTLHAPRS